MIDRVARWLADFDGIGECSDPAWIVYRERATDLLATICREGAYMTPEQMKLLAPDAKYGYGWLVFIPEGDTPLAGPDKAQ